MNQTSTIFYYVYGQPLINNALSNCFASANGKGLHVLDVAGEVLHWGGQLLVSYVLVGLAYGWTLSSRAVQNFIPDDKVWILDL